MTEIPSELNQIKVISECFIKPNHPTPTESYHYLGPIDLALLSIEPIQKGLLFKTDQIHSQIQLLLDKLKCSLSFTLDHFYPLAGQLATQKFPNEHACWVYVDCNKGSGARLIHAMVDLTVFDILSYTDVHPAVRSFFDLGEKTVNHDGHTRPLLSIQVTELLDGVFIGFTMNHSLADGTSLCHFISTLNDTFLQSESIAKGENSISISHKPIYKPFFPDGYGPIIKLPYLEPNEFISRFDPGPLRERIFHFSSTSMAKLKAKANEESGVSYISSFQALSTLMWRSITKARNLEPDLETTCAIITNTRQKLDPQISNDYFGNYIIRARGTSKVKELMENGFGWVAKLVHQTVKAQDEKATLGVYKRLVEAPFVAKLGNGSVFYRPDNVLIGGSDKFDMYGPEFGLGKAMAVLAGYPNKEDGKITANPGREGKGSVDLEVCLRPETMSALEMDQEFMRFVSILSMDDYVYV